MYKFKDKQIKFSDFGQPIGMKMNPENRWVKKAEIIMGRN
jgi:IS5 family transposase